MEEILLESELKLRKVRESWKEMEEYFDLTWEGLRTRILELRGREEEIGLREKELAAKEVGFGEGKSELESIRDLIDEYKEELGVRENRFEEVGELVREKEREFDLVEKRVKERCEELEECDREIAAKKEKLDLVLKAMVEYQRIIDSREEVIREMDLKGREFCLVKKSMEELSCRAELRKREVEGWISVLDVKVKDVESYVEELESIVERVRRQEEYFVSLVELIKEQEMHLCSLQKVAKEREKELESLCDVLDRKERCLEEVELKIVKLGHTVPSDVSDFSSSNWDGRGLQMFMNEQLKRIYSMGDEMTAILKASSDPAKLVLDAMQGFYPSSSNLDDKEARYGLKHIRRSCILLFEHLKRMSPQINAQVRNEAIKLAADWKTKMTVSSENTQEILGFLRLLSAYELSSMYDAKELQSLHAVVDKPEQASQSRTLGTKDNGPGKEFLLSLEDAKTCPEVTRGLKMLHDLKVKTVDSLIGNRRAVKQCLKEYHVESEYPYAKIEMQIVQLEEKKDRLIRSVPSIDSNIVEPQEQRKRKKPDDASSSACAFPPAA